MSKDYFTTASSTNQETPPVTLNYLQETIDSLKRTLQPPPSPPTIVTGNNCSRLWELAKIQKAQSGILPQGGAPVYTSEVLPDEFMVIGSAAKVVVLQVRDNKLIAYEVLPTSTLYNVYVQLLQKYGFGK